MPLLFSKYAMILVLLIGPDCRAISRPPTSNATSAADSAIRATLAAVMASPVLNRGADRIYTPGRGWARSALRPAAAGRAADRRAAGPAVAPYTGSSRGRATAVLADRT